MYRFLPSIVFLLVFCLSLHTLPAQAIQSHAISIQTELPQLIEHHSALQASHFMPTQTGEWAQIQIFNLDNPPDWLWAGAFVLPGLPQALLGNWGEGLAFFSGVALTSGGAYFSHYELTGLFAEEVGLLTLVPIFTVALMASALGIYIWNIADAHQLNQKVSSASLPRTKDFAASAQTRIATAVRLRLWEF